MTLSIASQVKQAIDATRGLPGVVTRPGVTAGDIARLEDQLQCPLPAAYRALLIETNGIEVAHGLDRWLGHGQGVPLDVVSWNSPTLWKWAYESMYGSELEDFLILAMDAHGPQLGCYKSDLQSGDTDPSFFVLSPPARPVAANAALSLAIVRGLVHTTRHPIERPISRAIMDRFGMVPPDRLVVHSPVGFPHFHDDETDLEGAVLLAAPDAMIAKADVCEQIEALAPGEAITGMQLWTDDNGRQRIRLQAHRTS